MNYRKREREKETYGLQSEAMYLLALSAGAYLTGGANRKSPTGAWAYLMPRNSKTSDRLGARWPTMVPLVDGTEGSSVNAAAAAAADHRIPPNKAAAEKPDTGSNNII